MKTGLEVLAARGFDDLRHRRVAVLSNHTGVRADLSHGVDAMVAAGIQVVGVLGPEHGFRGSATAGESEADCRDRRTGVPIIDAYRADEWALAEVLRQVRAETVVVDLADVGVRFYTYIWTMYRLMRAASLVPGTQVVVLDRPNPLGRRIGGGLLQPGCESEIGWRPILHQHGLTIGEMATVFNAVHLPAEPGGCSIDLSVVELVGWSGRPWSRVENGCWVAPSPNLPTAQAAWAYPGTGLLEAVTLAEGRGTTRPFTLVGAPWVDDRLVERLVAWGPPGVLLREASFQAGQVPHFETYAGSVCRGVELHIVDAEAFDAVALGVELLVAARDLYGCCAPSRVGSVQGGSVQGGSVQDVGGAFQHRGDDWRWLELMTGSRRFRDDFVAGATAAELMQPWQADQAEWNSWVSGIVPEGVTK